ncbi:MAG TPA: hypothetical protein VF883_13440 [Thermoanaerobaculia bacterium]
MTRFAHAVREELWLRGRRVESRLSHGQAFEDAHGITATDTRDDELVMLAEHELERLHAVMPDDALVRLVAEASTEAVTATMTVRLNGISIVTDPTHVAADIELLRTAATRAFERDAAKRSAGFEPAGPLASSRPPLPLVWQNGTAAILLHEAHAHPLEHFLPPLALPPWLEVEVPLQLRRATFRDIPLLRMQHVRVTQHDAPFELPAEHIEIHLIDSGAYDPLTDVVTLRIASSSVGPFTINEPRTNIRVLGAEGEPRRYPGVICSREGQELVVASYAPTLITA